MDLSSARPIVWAGSWRWWLNTPMNSAVLSHDFGTLNRSWTWRRHSKSFLSNAREGLPDFKPREKFVWLPAVLPARPVGLGQNFVARCLCAFDCHSFISAVCCSVWAPRCFGSSF